MGENRFSEIAKELVAAKLGLSVDQIYIVWLVKVLQNNKALLSTSVSGDGIYVELTYNGDKDEMYFDLYKKAENIKIEASDFNFGGK